MDTSFNNALELDPALKQAIERLVSTNVATVSQASAMAGAFKPMEQLEQLSASSQAFFKSLDWTQLMTKAAQPDSYAEPMKGLEELNKAALTALTDNQKALAESLLKDSKSWLADVDPTLPPQQALAKSINQWLDASADMQGKMTAQMSGVSSIQSAYTAWWQQTLTALASK